MTVCTEKKHKVFTAGGGTDIVLKEFVYKADKPGKIFYIQSGLHGGETSQWCLYKLHKFLLENLAYGEVHIVPYANPLAWMQRAYGSTFGKFSLIDGKDFNRCFPGNATGDVNGRICAALMNLAASADFVVDLHTSKSSNPFVIYTKKDYESMVKACGLPYNQYSDDASIPSLHGTFNAALDRAGVQNITIECGGHDEYDENKAEAVYQALCAVAAQLELLEKSESLANSMPVYVFEKRHKIYADACGLFHAEKNLGDEISQGEVIGKIYRADNLSEVEDVIAPENGVLHTLSAGHIVWEGDVLAEVIPLSDLRKLD